MKYSKPISELMAQCAAELPDRFRFTHVQRWFDAHYPDVNERTLRGHLIGLTEGPNNPNPYLAKKEPLFRRVEHGEYEVIGRTAAHESADATAAVLPAIGTASDVVLIVWHEREQRATPAPARDLFVSPAFAALRGAAEEAGRDWFVLTSEFGTVRPDDVIPPYARRVASESPAFRRAWVRWVTAKLIADLDGIEAMTIELRAGDQDVDDLIDLLEATGARVRVG